MVKSKDRGQNSDLRRRPATRSPKPRILIVCEGIVTESCYFEDLRRSERNSLVEIDIDDDGGVPKTLVERAVRKKKDAMRTAKRLRDDYQSYDEVWCVFDVDDHPALMDAKQQARDNGIFLAISNPCFELWALLHFEDHTSHIHRRKLPGKVQKYIPTYEKKLPYAVLAPLHDAATDRAEKLLRMHERNGTADGNPSTFVHLLVKSIKNPNRGA